MRHANQLAALVVIAASTGCYTGLSGARSDDDGGADTATSPTGGADDDDGGSDDGVPPPEDASQVGKSGMRRLTANEYDNTLRDLLFGDEAQSLLLLPVDARSPFDNVYADQEPSQALVEAADLLAADAADRLLADPPRRDLVVGCVPTGPDDAGCMRDFVTRFGRRVLRRPLADDEIDALLHGEDGGGGGALGHAIEADDFYTGVDFLMRTFLQDPQFLYRIEIGEPVQGEPGLFKLSDFEVATRLSYFLWGSGPDDALLDVAEAGGLGDPDAVREVTIGMLADERALDRIDRFHALWLGYDEMQFGGEIADAMREETRGLLERIVFEEQRPWQDAFRLGETLVDDTLAAHYGLEPPGSDTPVWVPYDTPERRGLLAHGTFLSVGFEQNDTNVVRRGLQVQRLLLCQEIAPPPPEVDTDMPVEGLCKVEKSAAHAQGGCANCHDLIDPVGFGLENFDSQGRYRTHEPDDPNTPGDESTCEIEGAGNLAGVGEFHGPAELAELAIGSGMLDACVVQQLYRWSTGHAELDELDRAFIEHVAAELEGGDFRFDELVLDFVGHEAFGYRREEG